MHIDWDLNLLVIVDSSSHPSIHPSTSASIHYLPIHSPVDSLTLPPVHPSTYPSSCLSIHPPIHPTCIHPTLCLSIRPSVHPSICLTIHPSTHLFVHLSIHPSSCPPVCPPLPSITCSLCAVCWFRPHLLTLPPPHLSRKLLLWPGPGSRRLVHLLCSSTSPLLHPLPLGTDP